MPTAVTGLATDVTAFVGETRRGPLADPRLITDETAFHREFGRRSRWRGMGTAIGDFFANGGQRAVVVRVPDEATPADYQAALRTLGGVEPHVAVLTLPPRRPQQQVADELWSIAASYAVEQGLFLLVDPPRGLAVDEVVPWVSRLGIAEDAQRNAALHYPRLRRPAPRSGRPELAAAVACGAVAGVYARTDRERGVWKAPAGLQTRLVGVLGPALALDEGDNDRLNPQGVNCLRTFADRGTVVWGSRTLRGSDALGDEFKYVPVRRLSLHLQASIEAGLAWTHGETNAEPLWALVRQSVGRFLDELWRAGAFAGSRPQEAYVVKADSSTMTAADVAGGVLVVEVGFAPTRPAEFVWHRIAQRLG